MEEVALQDYTHYDIIVQNLIYSTQVCFILCYLKIKEIIIQKRLKFNHIYT